MIAADTSSMIAYLAGQLGDNFAKIEEAMTADRFHLPPVVITELMSKPRNRKQLEYLFQTVPVLPVEDGFWERAGLSRQILLSRGLKAKLADTLIAQTCIDAGARLIAEDTDFRHFAEFCGLKLA